MQKFTVICAIRHDDESYGKGDSIELSADEAKRFAEAQAIECDDEGSAIPAGTSPTKPSRRRKPAAAKAKKPNAKKPATDNKPTADEVEAEPVN